MRLSFSICRLGGLDSLKKKKKNKNDLIPGWPTFLQQSHHFRVQLYNCAGMQRKWRENNEKQEVEGANPEMPVFMFCNGGFVQNIFINNQSVYVYLSC